MAVKMVVQPDDEKNGVGKKKKRSKCCTCLIVFAIVSIVIIAAIIGVGWYFGDKYTHQFFDMSLGETFDVLGDLYWTDDDDVVDRPYKKTDLTGFYDEIKRNVMLKTDAEIDFDGALLDAIDEYLGTGTSANSRASDGEGGDGEGDGNDILSILTGMLDGVFTKENLDVERLKEYDDEANDTYIFELKDKQLAAFVNAVLDAMLGKADDVEFLSAINEYVPLKSVVKLKQIKYVVQAKTDEQGVKTAATAVDITVWLGLQDAAGNALKKVLDDAGFGWAGGLAAWLGDVILPENVYVTATVPLEDGAEPKISFNTMNAAERKQMYKLVDGVFKNIMNSDMTVDSLLNELVDKIKPFLSQATDLMDFSEAKDGTVSIDLIGTIAKKVSDEQFKDDPLTKAELMYMLQALLTTTPEDRLHELEPYLYRAWYVDANGKNAVYKYDDSVVTDGKTLVDYGKKFIDEIEEVYALDFGADAEIADVLEMLGISLDGDLSVSVDTKELLKKIDRTKLNASLDPATSIRKLRLTDRMLAAALSGKLDTVIGDTFKDITVELDALTFVKDKNYPNRTFALLAVEVGIEDLFDSIGDNAALDLISGLLPSSILMNMQIDITMSRGAGEAYVPAQFMLNDYERTQGIIDTLKKFMPDLDFDSLTDDVAEKLRKMINKLDEILSIELVGSDMTAAQIVNGELVMPDLYTMVVRTLLTPEGSDAGVVTNEQLRSVMYGLNSTDAFAEYETSGDRTDDTPSGFISQVVDMYYLDTESDIETFDGLTDFLTDTEADQKNFGKKFRVKINGTTISDRKYLAYDTRSIEELTPVMTGAQLGAIIKHEMDDMPDVKDMFTLLDADISSQFITVVMQADIADFVPQDVRDLMSVETIYVTVAVDILDPKDGAYPVSFTVNSMDGNDIGYLMDILDFLDGSIDIESKTAEFGRVLYEQLENLRGSLENDDLVRFTDRGIEVASFYEFLSSKLNIQKDDPEMTDVAWAQRVKDVVQGMFERPMDERGNYITSVYDGAPDDKIKNYRKSDFVVNPGIIDPDFGNGGALTLLGKDMYDRQFNSWFQLALERNDVTALQTIALTAYDDGDEASAVRSLINPKISGNENGPATLDKDHVVISFELPMDRFSDESDKQDNTDTAYGFLPKYICATVVLDMEETDDGDRFVCVGTIVNNMNADEYDLLIRLMGLSPDSTDAGKVNLTSITNDCVNQINDILLVGGNITLDKSDDIERGVGTITISV